MRTNIEKFFAATQFFYFYIAIQVIKKNGVQCNYKPLKALEMVKMAPN